jgi:hypothetical protein
MTIRIRVVVPRFTVVGLAAMLVALSLHVGVARAIDCPPRVHEDPASNELCGREHYESAAAAQRCAYADRVARMTPEERDECGIGDKHKRPPADDAALDLGGAVDDANH